jgi:nicotinate-nucleotide adenylyltransferase
MGGTFDPPHLGHIVPVEIVAAEFHLDWVWFVPALIPPHKQDQGRTDPFQRTAMLALALKNFPKFKVSPVELLRSDISFTVDTIREFQADLEAQDRLLFIMGSDSFLEIQTWYAPELLLTLCEWIVMDRGDSQSATRNHLKFLETTFQRNLHEFVHFSSAPHISISSTKIRQWIAQGENVSNMLFPEVEEYIRKHSLYRR